MVVTAGDGPNGKVAEGGNFVGSVVGAGWAGGPGQAWDAELAAGWVGGGARGEGENAAGGGEEESVVEAGGEGTWALRVAQVGGLDGAVGDGGWGAVEGEVPG